MSRGRRPQKSAPRSVGQRSADSGAMRGAHGGHSVSTVDALASSRWIDAARTGWAHAQSLPVPVLTQILRRGTRHSGSATFERRAGPRGIYDLMCLSHDGKPVGFSTCRMKRRSLSASCGITESVRSQAARSAKSARLHTRPSGSLRMWWELGMLT